MISMSLSSSCADHNSALLQIPQFDLKNMLKFETDSEERLVGDAGIDPATSCV